MTHKTKDERRDGPDSESRRRLLQGALGLAAANLGGAHLIQAQVTDDLGVRASGGHRSASALAAAIRTGKVSAAEVVKAHLQQINAINPKINAVVRQRSGNISPVGVDCVAKQNLCADTNNFSVHGLPLVFYFLKQSITLSALFQFKTTGFTILLYPFLALL